MSKDQSGIIYKATNLITGKCYIGQTKRTFEKRQYEHIHKADVSLDIAYFHNSIRKYGIENFEWYILCDDVPIELLDIRETMKIIVEHSHWTENGYNLTWGGGNSSGMLGKHHTDETKKIMSERHAGINNPFYGKQHTEDIRKQISFSCSGKQLTEETKKKISDFRKGFRYTEESKNKMKENHADVSGTNNPMFGKKHTEETKRKIREKRKMQINIGKRGSQ